MVAEELRRKATQIQLVITDCDGVLTDGGVYYSAQGEAMKQFNIRDGMGVQRLREVGIETAILTGEKSESVVMRAKKLNIAELHLGCNEKKEKLCEIAERLQLELSQIAFIGDDVNDLQALAVVGLSACPADAEPEIQIAVDFKCARFGGKGAFREFAELIVKAKS